MNLHGIDISEDRLAEFCREWKVKGLALFGSILCEDFGPDSDIDVLVTFQPEAAWSLWDLSTCGTDRAICSAARST
ncbi:MAG: nucleotidyltransferase domain-containing protein [FCB group bacterium]|nr:nucleotidyltransferase domain-containing protein [FCB group bacterium]